MSRGPVALAVAAFCAGSCSAQSTVELRGGSTARVIIESVDLAGLVVRTDFGVETLPWHQIGSVDGHDDPRLVELLEAGEAAWRGLARLERGDPTAAEAPLEEAFAVLGGGDPSATAAAVAGGLLRCRVLRGDVFGAIEPWLVLRASVRAGVWHADRSAGMVDPESGLVPWLSPSLFAALPHGSASRLPEDKSVAGAIYAAAAAFERGDPAPMPEPVAGDAGMELLRAVVLARTGDETSRRIARRELWEVLDDSRDGWRAAWAEAGIGFSLLRESQSERPRAVAHLLAVPARYSDISPLLAGACLAEAAAVLADGGRSEDAQRLVRDLTEHFPGHPCEARPDIQRLLRRPRPDAPVPQPVSETPS
ncbi:MAG: hypothetical protein ACTS22_04685 [Phycisphaerales bacterium]